MTILANFPQRRSPSLPVASSLNSLVPQPILRWAGGKGQLLEQMINYLPQELLRGEIDRYIEPFMGGEAVFFWIAQHFKIKEFYLYDLNRELDSGKFSVD